LWKVHIEAKEKEKEKEKAKETTRLEETGETSISSSPNCFRPGIVIAESIMACLRRLITVTTSLTQNEVGVYPCPRGVHEKRTYKLAHLLFQDRNQSSSSFSCCKLTSGFSLQQHSSVRLNNNFH